MNNIGSAFSEEYQNQEGYVYSVYGKPEYLKHVLASVISLRRYDKKRPVALVCEPQHVELLEKYELQDLFEIIHMIDPGHRSIVDFKHNIDQYLFFGANIFLDSDIIWCKDPDDLWQTLSVYPFTITGNIKSDIFFGSHKGFRVLSDVLYNRRRRTLKRFGLTYLSRVQSGIIYARDHSVTQEVCGLAKNYMENKHKTHFQSRILPDGSTEESDEWGFAMAMSKLNLPVINWFQGEHSPQLDYISSYVEHDTNFENVHYLFYPNEFVYGFRGLPSERIRKWLINIWGLMSPSSVEKKWVTPYSIHFSWKHEKKPFYEFSDQIWNKLSSVESEKHEKVIPLVVDSREDLTQNG